MAQAFADAHIHFDDPKFAGLVPDFSDIAWLALAPFVAEIVAGIPGAFLVQVPLAEQSEEPESLDLERLGALDPWQPPSIHLLRAGSAYAIRGTHQPNAWYRDAAPAGAGAVGWVSSSRDDDAGLWRLSLMYETPGPTA